MRAPLYSNTADELLQQSTIDNPQPLLKRLRLHTPLSRVTGTGFHLVANRALLNEVLEREEDFSANLTGVLYRGENKLPACFELPYSAGTSVIATADEPRHGVHRQLIQPHFTPRAINAFKKPVNDWTHQFLKPIIANGGGDLVAPCERVPALVVARLLGLPESDVEHFRVWAMMGGDILAGEIDESRLIFLAEQSGQMAAYLGEHFDSAVSNPRTDANAPLLHTLARHVQADSISREEAIGIAIVLFGAAGESTAALMSSCIKQLAEMPETADKLHAEPDLIPRFVEEVVRLESPFKFHYRVVQHRCELAGFQLEKDDRLMLLWASANRDPDFFENPDQLRLDRKHPKQHSGFGRGLHFCVGAVLARLEARIMIEQLLETNRRLSIKPGGAVYCKSIFVRRLESLHLRLG